MQEWAVKATASVLADWEGHPAIHTRSSQRELLATYGFSREGCRREVSVQFCRVLESRIRQSLLGVVPQKLYLHSKVTLKT